MTLTFGSLTAGEWIEIDCDAYTITSFPGAGDFLSTLGVGETFFELRPPSTFTLECAAAALQVEHFRSYEA
jgi:hypothetical protein